jgi:hypothetical protein
MQDYADYASPPPSKKKRSAALALTSDNNNNNNNNSASLVHANAKVSTAPYRSSFAVLVGEQQVSQLQAELAHERSIRKLDERRVQQATERLQRQVDASVTDAEQARAALDDYRTASEGRIRALSLAHEASAGQLRACEIKLLQQEEDEEEAVTERHASLVHFYETKCQQMTEENQQEVEIAAELRAQVLALEAQLRDVKPPAGVTSPLPAVDAVLLEKASPAVLKELHRIRVALAETQRQERQGQRRTSDLDAQNRRLIQEREEWRQASTRLPVVQEQLAAVHQRMSQVEAEHAAWQTFGQALRQLLKLPPPFQHKGPPEMTAIEQSLAAARSQVAQRETQSLAWHEQGQRLLARVETKEGRIRELEASAKEAARTQGGLEKNLQEANTQIETLKAQQAVSQREAVHLRELITTFDDLPLASAAESRAGDILKSPKLDTSKRTLQISLDTANEEIRLALAERDRLAKQVEEGGTELERVKEKFGKLKEALQAERAKVAEAQERAHAAEALAGKGSFDPEKSRVMHLTETPLAEALKEEIKILKRQLETVKGARSSSKSAHHNPDKLNQRLKENFKEQIATFREGVYLMTGFKVDMLPNTDRPTFRVRSVYGEQEEDHMMLKWPKTEEVASLDLLNTDFAKSLSTTPSYDYMTKFHSLPAFMASVQLSLFEKQTMVIR